MTFDTRRALRAVQRWTAELPARDTLVIAVRTDERPPNSRRRVTAILAAIAEAGILPQPPASLQARQGPGAG